MVGRKIVINNLFQIICFNHDLAGGTDKIFNEDFIANYKTIDS